MIDEIIAEPIARDGGLPEDARRLDQRARRARDVLGAAIRAGDRRRGQLEAFLDALPMTAAIAR
jgi:hypothetical protein